MEPKTKQTLSLIALIIIFTAGVLIYGWNRLQGVDPARVSGEFEINEFMNQVIPSAPNSLEDEEVSLKRDKYLNLSSGYVYYDEAFAGAEEDSLPENIRQFMQENGLPIVDIEIVDDPAFAGRTKISPAWEKEKLDLIAEKYANLIYVKK